MWSKKFRRKLFKSWNLSSEVLNVESLSALVISGFCDPDVQELAEERLKELFPVDEAFLEEVCEVFPFDLINQGESLEDWLDQSNAEFLAWFNDHIQPVLSTIKDGYRSGSKQPGTRDAIRGGYRYTVQELVDKANDSEILEKCKEIQWHYIGSLQRNKVNKLLTATNLHMIETVHSKKLADTVQRSWDNLQKEYKLKVMVQINTSGEESKNGIIPCEASSLVQHILEECPSLEFAGLMTIGAFDHNITEGPNPDFLTLLQCRKDVCAKLKLEPTDIELSMGMSNDFEHAIELGSTSVRVGSAVFGARNYST